MKKAVACVVVGVTALVWSATAGAGTFKGTVVGHEGGSVLVASQAGLVRAFRGSPALGSRVAASNGALRVVGRSRSARIRGIFVRRIGQEVFLSSNHHLVALHASRLPASVGSAPTTPAPGDNVSAQVTIANGSLEEDSQDDLGPSNLGSLQVQATVTAVGAGTVTLNVNGQSLTLPLPAGLTLPASFVGQTVNVGVALGASATSGGSGDDQGDDQNGGQSASNGSGDDGTSGTTGSSGDGGGD